MSEISKKDLKKEIAKILKNANLKQTSSKKVRQKLEKVFKTDLTERKSDIDKLVMDYVSNAKESDDENKSEEEEEEQEEPEEEEEEEEEPKKRGKRGAPARKAAKPKKRKGGSDSEDDDEGSDSKDSDYQVGKKKKASDADSDEDVGKKKKTAKGKKAAAGRGKGSGYTRSYKLSPPLAELMGAEELPRHEVVKRVWALIKEKDLYDPNNKQFAICDDALYKVIGTKRFRAFSMMKYLKTHFVEE